MSNKQLFPGSQYKILIAQYPLKRIRRLAHNSLLFFIEFGLLSVGMVILLWGNTFGYATDTHLWFAYIAAIIIIIPITILLYCHMKILINHNGLLLYKDGFILPTEDFNVWRFESVFLEYWRVEAIWFWTERDRLGKLLGKGINLGEDPISVWGMDKCVYFDISKEPIPRDIRIVRLDVRLIGIHECLTTGAAPLEDGENAMRSLIISILESRKIPHATTSVVDRDIRFAQTRQGRPVSEEGLT